MNRCNKLKGKLGQLLCRHKHKGWYEKKETYHGISGERFFLICEDCGKIIDSFFQEYDDIGFK